MRFTIGAALLIALSSLAAPAPADGASVRHAARAGGDAAGLAPEAPRHVPARAHAQARDRHVGRADARVQRGPGLPRDHRSEHVLGAAPHDLRLLRPVRGERRAAGGRVRRADRARRLLAGGRLRRPPLHEAAPPAGPARQAELWGDEQWQALVAVIEERNPVVIGIDRSTVFAFSDGLSSGELQGMSAALGEKWTARFRNAEGLPLELLAVRLPEEEAVFRRMQELVWSLTQEMFSSRAITPGRTTTDDLEWWWRQRVNDLGLGTWFHPTVDVQRRGVAPEKLEGDVVIERGDLLHCDVGLDRGPPQHRHPAPRLRAAPGRDRGARGAAPRARERERPAGPRPRGAAPGPDRQRDPRQRRARG